MERRGGEGSERGSPASFFAETKLIFKWSSFKNRASGERREMIAERGREARQSTRSGRTDGRTDAGTEKALVHGEVRCGVFGLVGRKDRKEGRQAIWNNTGAVMSIQQSAPACTCPVRRLPPHWFSSNLHTPNNKCYLGHCLSNGYYACYFLEDRRIQIPGTAELLQQVTAAAATIATRLHGRVVKRVPFHHRRMRAACVCICGKTAGKTNTAEKNMKGEMTTTIVVVIPFEMPPNQFNFPFPCRRQYRGLAVGWLVLGRFVGELHLRAFTVV